MLNVVNGVRSSSWHRVDGNASVKVDIRADEVGLVFAGGEVEMVFTEEALGKLSSVIEKALVSMKELQAAEQQSGEVED